MSKRIINIIFITVIIVEGLWLMSNLNLSTGMQKALNLGYYCPSWDATGLASFLCYPIDKSLIIEKHSLLLEKIVSVLIITILIYGIIIFILRRKEY